MYAASLLRTGEAITRTQAKAAIAELAVTIRQTPPRNVLVFATLCQAEAAAILFQRGGMTCCWAGMNQPVLHTAADFDTKTA